MANLERLKRDIADIAQRRKHVTALEIQRVMSQLEACNYTVSERPCTHGRLYTVKGVLPFVVCEHNRGSQFVKSCYVKAFLGAMAQLDLFEE
jgi:hypothetical protein